MARIHNDNRPLSHEGQNHLMHGTQPTGNAYNLKTFPKMFGELVGKRIGTTLGDSNYLSCLVKYARSDEFKVEVLVQRCFKDANYNPDMRLRTSALMALTMKYEGRIDGIDRFSMQGLEGRTWTVGVNNSGDIIRTQDQCPCYDIDVFGVSEDMLRSDYGTFFWVADAEWGQAKAGSPPREELTPSNGLALPCGCP